MRDARRDARLMHTSLIVVEFTVLILAIFVGFEVISKVPTMLHTPLMSGTNAIHGIVLVGAIVVAGLPHQSTWIRIVALAAVALGTTNVVGGFVVTDRMLGMFRARRQGAVRESGPVEGVPGEPVGSPGARRGVNEQE
jgi:H+-translocating NAD(P) transhydrogenase subunit alpha